MKKHIFILFFFLINEIYASAYIRRKGELFLSFDTFYESSNFLKSSSNDYWNNQVSKLYFEYGMSKNMMLNGYLKKYNFTHKYYYITDTIKNDFYGNMSLTQNIYNDKTFFLSASAGVYSPLKYDKTNSLLLNNIETKNAFDFALLFFKKKNFYFVDGGVFYKIIEDGYKDELKFYSTITFGKREDSSFGINYEQKWFVNEKNDFAYGYDNNKTIKMFVSYKFIENFITEFSAYKKISATNSIGGGVVFSFAL